MKCLNFGEKGDFLTDFLMIFRLADWTRGGIAMLGEKISIGNLSFSPLDLLENRRTCVKSCKIWVMIVMVSLG